MPYLHVYPDVNDPENQTCIVDPYCYPGCGVCQGSYGLYQEEYLYNMDMTTSTNVMDLVHCS